jgi:hypothetical protein
MVGGWFFVVVWGRGVWWWWWLLLGMCVLAVASSGSSRVEVEMSLATAPGKQEKRPMIEGVAQRKRDEKDAAATSQPCSKIARQLLTSSWECRRCAAGMTLNVFRVLPLFLWGAASCSLPKGQLVRCAAPLPVDVTAKL